MKKRKFRLSLLFLALAILSVAFSLPIKMESVNCSYVLNKEVLLVSEFVGIKDSTNVAKSIGVLSFKVGDVLYGVGHHIGLDEEETYSAQRIRPMFIKKTEKNIGMVQASTANDISFGNVISDTKDGLVVSCNNIDEQEYSKIEIANKITTGKAQLLMRDEQGKLQSYCVTIEVVTQRGKQRLDITITDKKLQEKTGGIIPGMSGCPIIQNNKLVGIVSATYVDDEYKGIGKIIWDIV